MNPRNEAADATPVSFAPMASIDTKHGYMGRFEDRPWKDVRKSFTHFANGDVVVAKITPCFQNLKSFVAKDLTNGLGAGSTELHVLRPHAKLLADFALLVFRSPYYIDNGLELVKGTAGQQRIPLDFFRTIPLPVPPQPEQERLVQLVNEVIAQVDQAEEATTHECRKEEALIDGAVRRLYDLIALDAPQQPFGEVAPVTRRPVEPSLDETYTEIGVRSFGNGLFVKDPVSLEELGDKRVFTIAMDDLIFSNIFAWEGAIAVADAEHDGLIGSHRFITCIPKEGRAMAQFLQYHFLTPEGLADVLAASPGGAGRNRTLGLRKLEKLIVPVPNGDQLRTFASALNLREEFRHQKKQALRIADIVSKQFTAKTTNLVPVVA